MLKQILNLKNYNHMPIHHPEGSVYKHTRAAWNIVRKDSRVVRLAVLLHDIGKQTTYKFQNDKHTYYGHDQETEFIVSILDNITLKEPLTKDEKEAIIFCMENHMRFKRIPEMRKAKVLKLKKSGHARILGRVCFADEMSRGTASDIDGYIKCLDILIKA